MINQTTRRLDAWPSDGGVWYQLRLERERICKALLVVAPAAYQLGAIEPTNRATDTTQPQARLRLIDDALDRLMAGSFGDCVVCGRWIEDTKLHDDAALPFCCACLGRSSTPAPPLPYFPYQLSGLSPEIRGLLRS